MVTENEGCAPSCPNESTKQRRLDAKMHHCRRGNRLTILLFLGILCGFDGVFSFVVVENHNPAFSGDPNTGRQRRERCNRHPRRHVLLGSAVPQKGLDEGTDSGTGSPTSQLEDSTPEKPPGGLVALGWQAHFASQLEGFQGGSSEEGGRSAPLVPMRITEVRSKTIHAVGAREDTAGGANQARDAAGEDWLIPVTPGQKIINRNEEKVVVAGDWILVEKQERTRSGGQQAPEEEPPRIRAVLERRSVLKRRAPGRNTRKAQLIAANLDTVFVVSSCNQDFNVARLERYIAMVLETDNVEPVVVLTKKDLLEMGDGVEDEDTDDEDLFDDEDFDDEDFDSSWLLDYYTEEATSIAGGSVPVVCLDARNRQDATSLLAPWLGPGQTVAFVGSSGVGKSTLANTLCGTRVAATGDIHTDSGQGRHTTTRRQLHFIRGDCGDAGAGADSFNGAVLDTPGLRELQLVDAARGLDLVFADLVDLSKSCRFRDCKHRDEPGCAIRAAVENEEVDQDRVARWFKLVAEEQLNSSEVAEGKKERERKRNLKKRQKEKQRRQKKKFE